MATEMKKCSGKQEVDIRGTGEQVVDIRGAGNQGISRESYLVKRISPVEAVTTGIIYWRKKGQEMRKRGQKMTKKVLFIANSTF